MRRLHTNRDGFTLIELMITVAIIGILASTAIAGFNQYQYRSKRAEAMSNLSSIAKSEIAYFGEYGVFFGTNPMPPGVPTPAKRVWDAVSLAEYGGLGWQPEGALVYSFDVNDAPGDCGCPAAAGGASCFTASATGDVDGDGSMALVAYFHPGAGGGVCATALFAFLPPINVSTGAPILAQPTVIPVVAGSDDY